MLVIGRSSRPPVETKPTSAVYDQTRPRRQVDERCRQMSISHCSARHYHCEALVSYAQLLGREIKQKNKRAACYFYEASKEDRNSGILFNRPGRKRTNIQESMKVDHNANKFYLLWCHFKTLQLAVVFFVFSFVFKKTQRF